MMGCFAVMEIENTTLKPLRNVKIIVEECTKKFPFSYRPIAICLAIRACESSSRTVVVVDQRPSEVMLWAPEPLAMDVET